MKENCFKSCFCTKEIKNCHPEFISGSTPLITIQNKEEMLEPRIKTLRGAASGNAAVQHGNRRRAFTLIELLVVVLIIGILAAVAVPQYRFAVEKARFVEATTVIANLQRAIDAWVLANDLPSLGKVSFSRTDEYQTSLDIDVTNGMDCSVREGACATKHFFYTADCSVTGCGIGLDRRIQEEGESYYVNLWRGSDGVWKYTDCTYYDEYPIGEKICKWLEKEKGVELCHNC